MKEGQWKLDGAVDKFSADQKIVNLTLLYITCGKSGGLHLAEPGLAAGWQSCSSADEIWVRLETLKSCYRSKYSMESLLLKIFSVINNCMIP